MGLIEDVDRGQLVLFPGHPDDWIGEDIRPSRKPIAVFRDEGHVHPWNVGLVAE